MEFKTLSAMKSTKPSDGAFADVESEAKRYVFREAQPGLVPDDVIFFASTVDGREDKDRWELVRDGDPDGGSGGDPYASQAEAEAGVATNRAMNPLRVAQAIAALGGSGGGSSDVIYFEPGIVASSGNRCKTLAEIQTAADAAVNRVEVIVVSPGVGNVINIPVSASPWDFSKCIFKCAPQTILPQFTFADGSTIAALPSSIELIHFINQNTTDPLCTISSVLLLGMVSASLQNSNSATTPFMLVTSTGFVSIFSEGISNPLFSPNSTVALIEVHATFSMEILSLPSGSFFQATNIFSDLGIEDGNVQLKFYGLLPLGYSGSNPNLGSGSPTVTMLSETRVDEKIATKVDYDFPVDRRRYLRVGNYIDAGATDYANLGRLDGFSPTADVVPANETWLYEITIFSYHFGSPNAAPEVCAKTFLGVWKHDSGTSQVTAQLAETGSSGSLAFSVAPITGPAPQSPQINITNSSAHRAAFDVLFTRLKNDVSTPLTHS